MALLYSGPLNVGENTVLLPFGTQNSVIVYPPDRVNGYMLVVGYMCIQNLMPGPGGLVLYNLVGREWRWEGTVLIIPPLPLPGGIRLIRFRQRVSVPDVEVRDFP